MGSGSFNEYRLVIVEKKLGEIVDGRDGGQRGALVFGPQQVWPENDGQIRAGHLIQILAIYDLAEKLEYVFQKTIIVVGQLLQYYHFGQFEPDATGVDVRQIGG